MRLREIKPGMVIHCKTQEEKKILLEELEKQGYTWPGGKKPTDSSNLAFSSIHVNTNGCDYITWSGRVGNTEFSDLIIPELSTEEVLRICNEICGCKTCAECPMQGNCFINGGSNFKKIIEICEQWKVDHDKKESEVEWVNICRIIKGTVLNKRCVHEEDITGLQEMAPYSAVEDKAQEILKKYISEHDGNYIAVVERVCRVKK